MRIVLTSWGSRGDVEPLAALGLRLRERGAEVVVCAPPDEDFAVLLSRAGLQHVPLGRPVKAVVAGERKPTAQDAFRLAADLVAARFETLGEVAADADALLATGLMPAGARSVAEHLGIPYVLATFHTYGKPSHHFPPGRRPGTPSSSDETDLETLWREDAERVDALYGPAENSGRAALGLPPVTGVRDHVFSSRPWLAADPLLVPWKDELDLEVIQTGAWILPDERPLPFELEAFLAAGPPPVYVGFGSIASFLPSTIGAVAVEAVRAQGHRVLLGSGWAGLSGVGDDCLVVGEVNQQALFARVAAVVHHGGIGTTTTAARAGAPQVIVPPDRRPAPDRRPHRRARHRRRPRRPRPHRRVPGRRAVRRSLVRPARRGRRSRDPHRRSSRRRRPAPREGRRIRDSNP